MKNNHRAGNVGTFLSTWKNSYFLKTISNSAISFGCTVLFALYHCYLGIRASSIWHGSISIFYILLIAIRGSILLTEKKNRARVEPQRSLCRRRTFLISSVLLLILDLSLILPVALMVTLAKPVSMGLIPSIAMAAYTTYKITMASIHIRKQKRNSKGNILVTELRIVNFIDALVSILTLQNTLIMVNQTESDAKDMFLLSIISSTAIYCGIVAITIYMMRKGLKEKRTISAPQVLELKHEPTMNEGENKT